jgi:CBS domain containing-hemolysin-like protein
MSDPVLGAGAQIVTGVAAVWAALLGVVQEAPAVASSLGEPPAPVGQPVPLDRALQISRLALVLVAACGAGLALEWWSRPPAIALLQGAVALVFLLTLSDLVPRALGVLFPHVAAAAVPLARRSLFPFKPLIGLIGASERLASILFPLGIPSAAMVRTEERDMLAGVVSLRDTTVAEIMTPRLDIVGLEASAEWSEVVERLRRSEHHRLPVFGEDLDDLRGIVHAKDLTPIFAGLAPRPDHWHSLIRPAQYVPESKLLASQLHDFQRGTSHLAIVVDEFGGTSGLITLEDVLEEIVGEIYGEYDQEEIPDVVREGDDRFWISGTVTLDTLSEALGTPLDHEEVSTVGGLVYSELGRVPRPGEELHIGEFRVVVEKVVRRRIQRVYFEREPVEATGRDTE